MLAAAIMFGGPFDRQVLHSDHVFFKSWRPYGGTAYDVCVADFYVVAPDGSIEEVSRLRALHGVDHWWEAKFTDRHLRSPKAVHGAARALCGALRVEDVRVEGRCAAQEGWAEVDAGVRNHCRSAR